MRTNELHPQGDRSRTLRQFTGQLRGQNDASLVLVMSQNRVNVAPF